jgi:hypothetical protein
VIVNRISGAGARRKTVSFQQLSLGISMSLWSNLRLPLAQASVFRQLKG